MEITGANDHVRVAALSASGDAWKSFNDELPQLLELIAGLEGYLEGELGRVFSVTSRAGADVFEVGKTAIRSFRSWEAWEAYGFARRLKDTEAAFTVRVKLSHSPRDPALE